MNRKLLGIATAAVCGMIGVSAANASLLTIGLQETGVNGGAIFVVDTSTTGGIVWAPTVYGHFVTAGAAVDTTSLLGGLPEILNSNSLDASLNTAGAAHTLTVYVTSQGLTLPGGTSNWASSFTSNSLPAGWSVTTTDFFDPTNGLYNAASCAAPCLTTATGLDAAALQLRTATFSAIGTAGPFIDTETVSGPYSITEVYTITGFWNGSTGQTHTANTTIDLSAVNIPVPEPASLAIFGSALLGFGLIRRRRNS